MARLASWPWLLSAKFLTQLTSLMASIDARTGRYRQCKRASSIVRFSFIPIKRNRFARQHSCERKAGRHHGKESVKFAVRKAEKFIDNNKSTSEKSRCGGNVIRFTLEESRQEPRQEPSQEHGWRRSLRRSDRVAGNEECLLYQGPGPQGKQASTLNFRIDGISHIASLLSSFTAKDCHGVIELRDP